MDLGGPTQPRLVGNYILGPRIGSGSFAVVWRSTHRELGMEVAVKDIDKKLLNSKVSENLLKEISILSTIDHPNIIRLFEAIENEDRIYLVLEYCDGGDLADYIRRHGKVSEHVARDFMRQLAAGLQVLQEKHLIHRDLKPQNLLLSTKDETPVLKIGDFGFARSLTPQGLADTLCGSPLYMAPEIIQNQKYDAKADLWSVGAILFQLVTGKPPFDGNNQLQLFQNILTSTELRFPEGALGELHPDCVDLCRSLLRQNPVERLTFKEFFSHKFLVESRQMANVEMPLPQSKSIIEQLDSSLSEKRPQMHSGVLPVFDEDTKDGDSSLFDQEEPPAAVNPEKDRDYVYEDDEMEDGEIESDSSSYRVLSSKSLADVVEALIGVDYVEGGKNAANHLMKWIGIQVESDPDEIDSAPRPASIPESILRSVDFDSLEGALNIKFKDRSLLVEAITHASHPSSGVSCYQRLEFVGDAVLDHLITRHLFFTYTNLPPGRLTDLRAAAVNNENFARVAVKHKLHVHLRHGSSALDKQIRDFVREVQDELSKPGFNSFGLGDCKAPKVLGDIVESIAGAIFLDSGLDTAVVWKVFQPLLQPMVTPETLPMHPVRELQERCQQQAEGLEYKATRSGNLATVEVYIDGVQVGVAQNPQKKMAQKLAARNALAVLKEKETAEAKEKGEENGKKKNGTQTFTRQTLNDICLRRNWPMPHYRFVHEGGPAHAKRFTYAVRVNTSDRGWTDECIGEPMPSVKKAKDSSAVLLLELLNKRYS